MLDVKDEIIKALLADPDIISLLGGKRVYRIKAPDATEFPRITVWTVLAQKADYFDDAPVRANRLKLLNRIRVATRTVADFSKIEG